jgi:phage terminase large subunit
MNLEFPAVFLPLFDQEARFYVSDGGRGGGRSWSFARFLLIKGAQEKHRILCAREFQTSIRDSVHRLLSDQVEALGLSAFYTITQAAIVGVNGTEFLFKGLHHNVSEIKSMEGITYCWVEEAEKVSAESWDFLIPTIRAPGSKILVTFNPYRESDPTYQRFILNPAPGTVRMRAGYRENPWFPEILRSEMEHDKNSNPDRYLWVWEGQCLGISDAQIYRGKYVIESFDEPDKQTELLYGADWGFAKDPSTLIRCWIKGKKLYIDHEAYGVGVEIDKTPALFDQVPDARRWPSYADCARPETISYMVRNGYPMMKPAKKWAGSVEDGIAYLRGFNRIFIHTSCKHTYEEFRLYSYKTDSNNGDVLPVIVDKHNHGIDALRYSLDGYIRAKGELRTTEVRAGILGL